MSEPPNITYLHPLAPPVFPTYITFLSPIITPKIWSMAGYKIKTSYRVFSNDCAKNVPEKILNKWLLNDVFDTLGLTEPSFNKLKLSNSSFSS